MRLSALLLACWVMLQTACVSSNPAVEYTPKPYPVYSVRKPIAPPSAPRVRVSPRRALGHPKRHWPRAWYPPGRRISDRWSTIVIHHSATGRGDARLFDKHHRQQNGWDELGYHFVIGNGSLTPDGRVEVGPRWAKQKHGAHCKTPDNYFNQHGIGICLVGDFTRSSPSPRQLASLTRLIQFLSETCGIAPNRVTTHRAVTGKTECPGRRFPIASFLGSLRAPAVASSIP